MKGLLLAGGSGSRLLPTSRAVNKHLCPIYNKPMIYYPLSTLISFGIREIAVVTGRECLTAFANLLGDGTQFGVAIRYCVQETPRGLADAFIVGRQFIAGENVCAVLGDNLFWGPRWEIVLSANREFQSGAKIFTKEVADPGHYGVVNRDENGRPCQIEEKPRNPKSREAVTGFYLFDSDVADKAASLSPSQRDELEITDLIQLYLRDGTLQCESIGEQGDGVEWFDTGTPDNMVLAAQLVRGAEHTGALIGSPEAAAYHRRYIDSQQLLRLADEMGNCEYGRNLRILATA